jgi:hypothetical protein
MRDIMKNIFKKIAILLLVVTSFSCDLNGDLENPNEVGLSGADINLIMNSLQLDFADFFSAASDLVDPLVRMQAMTGGFRYQNAILPQDANTVWFLAYGRVLVNAKAMIPLAEAKNLTTHVAVAKILQAYVLLTLVDLFGNVPDSEALNAAGGNFNPNADPGADVYAHAIALLTEARTELAKTGTDAGLGLTRDIYYDGNRARWAALANTLEMKAWLNLSMISARQTEANNRITQLLSTDLIDTEAENFTYKYSSTTVPDSRHPLYNQYYGSVSSAANGYICNSFLYELYNGKGVQDPRWRYYFYRQVGSVNPRAYAVDPKSVGCSPGAIPNHYIESNSVFCFFEPGFYGRDHGDASGTPPDSPVITCAGAYPAAGRIDNNPTANTSYFNPTIRGQGGDGAGIQPIFMSFFTDYMKAEFLARTGNTAGAKTKLVDTSTGADGGAIAKSIAQVRSFSNSKGQVLTITEPSTANYLSAVSTLYDDATNKLKVIGREFYVACWGNGIEAYNVYRRTSAPDNFQPTLQLNPGPFFRKVVYPADYVNLNNNATQIDITITNKVFWDTNPDDLK